MASDVALKLLLCADARSREEVSSKCVRDFHVCICSCTRKCIYVHICMCVHVCIGLCVIFDASMCARVGTFVVCCVMS